MEGTQEPEAKGHVRLPFKGRAVSEKVRNL